MKPKSSRVTKTKVKLEKKVKCVNSVEAELNAKAVSIKSEKYKSDLPKLHKMTPKKKTPKLKMISISFVGKSGYKRLPVQKPYKCPVVACNDPIREMDSGLHLLVDNNLSYCLECSVFCESRGKLIQHHRRCHLTRYANPNDFFSNSSRIEVARTKVAISNGHKFSAHSIENYIIIAFMFSATKYKSDECN